MTKPTHTPGPWVVHESGGFCYIRPADHEPGVMAVAQVCKRPNYEQKPNARLISAAPEMLAALEALTRAYAESMNADTSDLWDSDLWDNAVDAIAKARGP